MTKKQMIIIEKRAKSPESTLKRSLEYGQKDLGNGLQIPESAFSDFVRGFVRYPYPAKKILIRAGDHWDKVFLSIRASSGSFIRALSVVNSTRKFFFEGQFLWPVVHPPGWRKVCLQLQPWKRSGRRAAYFLTQIFFGYLTAARGNVMNLLSSLPNACFRIGSRPQKGLWNLSQRLWSLNWDLWESGSMLLLWAPFLAHRWHTTMIAWMMRQKIGLMS